MSSSSLQGQGSGKSSLRWVAPLAILIGISVVTFGVLSFQFYKHSIRGIYSNAVTKDEILFDTSGNYEDRMEGTVLDRGKYVLDSGHITLTSSEKHQTPAIDKILGPADSTLTGTLSSDRTRMTLVGIPYTLVR